MNEILQKRIEEAARDIAELCPDCDLHCEGLNPCIPKILYQKLIEISTFALQNQWISIEEDLPNVDSNGYSNLVLVKCRFHPNDNIVATYSSLSNLWLSDGLRLEVTHWMEIPSLEGGEE